MASLAKGPLGPGDPERSLLGPFMAGSRRGIVVRRGAHVALFLAVAGKKSQWVGQHRGLGRDAGARKSTPALSCLTDISLGHGHLNAFLALHGVSSYPGS